MSPGGTCDRSLARSARNSATQKSRPVGYGLIRAGVRTDSMIGVTKFRIGKLRSKHGAQVDEKYLLVFATPDHTVPYGTVLSRDAFPRHFVPGYDRCCPYGDCRTSAKNEVFSCFWTMKTA